MEHVGEIGVNVEYDHPAGSLYEMRAREEMERTLLETAARAVESIIHRSGLRFKAVDVAWHQELHDSDKR